MNDTIRTIFEIFEEQCYNVTNIKNDSDYNESYDIIQKIHDNIRSTIKDIDENEIINGYLNDLNNIYHLIMKTKSMYTFEYAFYKGFNLALSLKKNS